MKKPLLSSFFPLSLLMKFNNYHKNISANGKAFIDLCRCLYQAKAVVRDLEAFSHTLSLTLNQYPKVLNNQKCTEKSNEKDVLLKQANQYLNTTFQKFTRLCKLLFIILTKMESGSTGQVKRERIDSFRAEIWQEWKMVTDIKQKILELIQFNDDTIIYTFTANASVKTPTSEL